MSANTLETDWNPNAVRKELTWDDDGQPVLKIKNFAKGGDEDTLTGMQALRYAPKEALGVSQNTSFIAPAYLGPDDYRESFSYKAGQGLRGMMDDPEPTWLGRIFDSGPVAGSLVGAGSGWLAGHGLNWLLKKLNKDVDLPLSTIGLLSGGVLGGIIGHFRNKKKEERESLQGGGPNLIKESMFRDPRNFILERLQGATDLTPFEKAQLAARVRQMDTRSAEKLKAMVRAAVGFGVGAIIAKFFGASIGGMGVGGLLGMGLGMLAPTGNRKPTGLFTGSNYY